MSQFMQPLTGITDEATAGWVVQLRITLEGEAQAVHPFGDPRRQRQLRRCRELPLQKLMKPLLTSLQIPKAPFGLQSQGALNRSEPCQQHGDLISFQSPFAGCIGSTGFCQRVRASRSRERRSQWRCCWTILIRVRWCS